MATFISREEAQRIAERALLFSTADQARVNLSSTDTGNTRFAQRGYYLKSTDPKI